MRRVRAVELVVRRVRAVELVMAPASRSSSPLQGS